MFRSLRAIAVFALALSSAATPSFADTSELEQNYVPTSPVHGEASFTFEDASHQQVSLKDFYGKYVLLNVWATWCTPCIKEMPALNEMARQMVTDTGNFMVMPLNEDREGHIVATVFNSRAGLKYLPIFVDQDGKAPTALHLSGLPTSILLDPKGTEIGRIIGPINWSDPANMAYLNTLINPPPPVSKKPGIHF